MMIKKGFLVEGVTSRDDERIIKNAVMELDSVVKVLFNFRTKIGYVSYDDTKTNIDDVLDKIEEYKDYKGYILESDSKDNQNENEKKLFIEGMHCPSCEVLVERKLKKN